jgi:hypothetical protein
MIEESKSWPQGLPGPDVEIAPLDAKHFVERLRRFTEASLSLAKMRRAFVEQHPELLDGLSRGPSRTRR